MISAFLSIYTLCFCSGTQKLCFKDISIVRCLHYSFWYNVNPENLTHSPIQDKAGLEHAKIGPSS